MGLISSFSNAVGGVYPSLSLYLRLPSLKAEHLVSTHKPQHLRLSVGVIGNGVALLLYAAPILTFKRVIKGRSTGEFSCVPYITALLNCLIYTWYSSPMVSNKWDNLPLFTINGFGVVMESSFILTYILFASPRGKKAVYMIMAPVVAFFIGMVISTSILKDHHLRKSMVGGFGLVACIAMYSSPMVVVKRVIQTRSVEFMPFSLSFFSFLASSLWTAYGLLSHDLLLALPNLLGCPLGVIQLVLYFMYRKKEAKILEEPIRALAMEEVVAPLKVDIAEQNKETFETNVEEINEAPPMVDIEKISEAVVLLLNVDVEENEPPLRMDIERIEEHIMMERVEENQTQMGLPIPFVVSVSA